MEQGGGLEAEETGARVSAWALMLCAGQVRSHHREEAGEGRRWRRGGGGLVSATGTNVQNCSSRARLNRSETSS